MHGVFDALKDVLRVGYDASKTKTALRLALGRLKLLRNKRESARRAIEIEVGEMLKQSRGFGYDAARIRCETVCREDATLKGYEILELTLETLLARLPAVSASKAVPEELREAIATVIYAAKRAGTEVPELETLKKQFGRKYGREYVAACEGEGTASACGANATVLESLKVKTVDDNTVQRRLEAIAAKNGVVMETPIAIGEEVAMPASESNAAYASAARAAAAAEAAAQRAEAAAAIVASASLHAPSDDATKELSDADVEAVIDEVLAMPDLTVEDATAKPSAPSGPPPGVGQPISDKKVELESSDASDPAKPKAYPKPSAPEEQRGPPTADADDLAGRFAALKKGP